MSGRLELITVGHSGQHATVLMKGTDNADIEVGRPANPADTRQRSPFTFAPQDALEPACLREQFMVWR